MSSAVSRVLPYTPPSEARGDLLLDQGQRCSTLHPPPLTTSSSPATTPQAAPPGRAKPPTLHSPPLEPPRPRRGKFGVEEESLQPSIDPSKEVAKLHTRDKKTTIEGMQERRQGSSSRWESSSRDGTALDW